MKKFFAALLLLASSNNVYSFCLNNENGQKHVQKRGAKDVYLCAYKTKQYYGDQADKYYNGDICKSCGCGVGQHRDPLTIKRKQTGNKKKAATGSVKKGEMG